MKLFKKFLSYITPPRISKDSVKKELIRREAEIGGQLFGPVPSGHHRDFFYLGNHTWFWNETYKDAKGQERIAVVRYEVHPDKIVKAQDGFRHQIVDGEEAKNFYAATQWYHYLVSQRLYS